MRYCNLFDSHTHTLRSPDGEDSCTANALAALDKGLQYAMEMPEQAGLTRYAFCRKRKPVMLRVI